MVYDLLPHKTRHHHAFVSYVDDKEGIEPITLAYKTFPSLGLLRTCRQIHSEAGPILKRLDAWRREPLRLIIAPYQLPDHLKHVIHIFSLCINYDCIREMWNLMHHSALTNAHNDLFRRLTLPSSLHR